MAKFFVSWGWTFLEGQEHVPAFLALLPVCQNVVVMTGATAAILGHAITRGQSEPGFSNLTLAPQGCLSPVFFYVGENKLQLC